MPNRVALNPADPEIRHSREWLARAEARIPCATQTLAKGPTQFVRGVAPVFLKSGKGARVVDVDGNEFLDFSMGVGPLILGYGYPRVDDAIRSQLADGITFSLMHPLEVRVAELLHEIVPGAESVRFSKTGADVTSAAVRLARAFTGRDRVLCCGYHGWHDWYVSVTSRSAGVPNAVRALSATFAYNDVESVLDAIDGQTAAVILEPVTFEEPHASFLSELKRACRKRGALLIFDEMWTGFRLALGGAQEHFGVTADLACFSKALANGMPLSALTGRRDVMRLLEDEVFFFTTFGGEALSLAAAEATLSEMREQPVHLHLTRLGRRLRDGINDLAAELGMPYVKAVGPACRSMLVLDPSAGDPLEMKSLVQQELIRSGVLWAGFHNLSYSHSEADIEHTLLAYREALAILGEAVPVAGVAAALRGLPVAPVFRRATGFNSKPRQTVKV